LIIVVQRLEKGTRGINTIRVYSKTSDVLRNTVVIDKTIEGAIGIIVTVTTISTSIIKIETIDIAIAASFVGVVDSSKAGVVGTHVTWGRLSGGSSRGTRVGSRSRSRSRSWCRFARSVATRTSVIPSTNS
jgi:hypothetical protein